MKRVRTHRKTSWRARILRLLGTNRGFDEIPSGGREGRHVGLPTRNYPGSQRAIATALLKAEHKKAEAAMEGHRRRFIW